MRLITFITARRPRAVGYVAFECPLVAFDLRGTVVSAAVYVTSNNVQEYAKAIADLGTIKRPRPVRQEWKMSLPGSIRNVPAMARTSG